MTGDLARTGATMVAVGRLGAGLVALVWPEFAARCWLGDRGRGPAARVLGRGLGGRDLALAVGALAALRDGGPADRRRWLALGCLADSGDALATLLAWSSLPPVRRAIVLAASVGAAAVGLAAAREAQLSRR
jgi:hypothetical protein